MHIWRKRADAHWPTGMCTALKAHILAVARGRRRAQHVHFQVEGGDKALRWRLQREWLVNRSHHTDWGSIEAGKRRGQKRQDAQETYRSDDRVSCAVVTRVRKGTNRRISR